MSAFRLTSFLGSLMLVSGLAFGSQADPPLLKALSSRAVRGPLPVIVNLKGRFDIKRLDNLPRTQLERGRAIAAAMERFTAEASKPMVNFLKSQDGVTEVTPIWITNSLRVKAPKAVIEKLLAMNGSESILLDAPKDVEELQDRANASFEPSPMTWSDPDIAWGVKKLGAPKIWERGDRGQGALVAMIDTGVNLKHPDLMPALWKNPGETGVDASGNDKATNGIDDDGNGYIDDVVGWNFEAKTNDPTDDNGHGSQTAGIVGGRGVGGTQTGVAPGATLMILKSCCNEGGKVFESQTWEAIQYAIKNGAKVISMSLSAKDPGHPQYAKWRQVGEVELAAGIIHVNSAGNLGSGNEPHNIGAPASNPPAWFFSGQTRGGMTSMITIGASDENDQMRDYSSVGPVSWEDISGYNDYPYDSGKKPGLIKPEVCAPSEVPSTSMEGTGYTSEFGGTSSATPHIGGVVALLVSAKPDLTPAQATEALMTTAIKVEDRFTNHCGAGRVDAQAALDYVQSHFK